MTKSVNQLINFFAPEHYDLMLDINRIERKFSGTVKIRGKQTGEEIRLHAKDLDISLATVNGEEVKLKKYENDEIGLKGAGQGEANCEIYLEFSGQITDSMHGLYPCYYEVDGEKKELLATQFESHHAREVFPCVDEPAAKATFDLTLITESDVEVLSNMPIRSQDILQDLTLQKTTFETTPKMSTYLLAFATGDLQKVTAKTESGVEVNIYATKAQKAESLDFALETATRAIDFYDEYFGIKYPLPKSDHIALPDFSSGAMENWGLITYRETALLADKNTGLSSKQYIATVIAHELSHQWFGNLVTMKWWDDLWLNESFASLMEHISTDALFPDWQMWLGYETGDVVAALRRDALTGVQPVRQDVNHPDEISTLFDSAIVYAKGERLLKMCRAFIGEQAFRAGLQKYFAKFQYRNTEANDLWNCLSEASGQDIASLMTPWLTRPHYPIVCAGFDDKTGEITLKQEKFIASGKNQQTKVVILHGTNKNPQEDWYSYIKSELENLGAQVFVPEMPIGDAQNIENWCKALREQVPFEFDSNTILIGHSVGATYMLSILNRERKEPLKASIFVGGFYKQLNHPEIEKQLESFVELDFNWNLIKKNAGKVIQLHGDDDPAVPLEQAKELSGNLNSDFTVIKNGGHLNRKAGYIDEFPELVEKLQEIFGKSEIWPIPLFVSDKNAPKLMREREISFTSADLQNFRLNIENNGHFIVATDKTLCEKITLKLMGLPLADRLQTLNTAMMLARAGQLSTANYLDILTELKEEKSWAVWDSMSLIIGDLKRFVENDDVAEMNLKKMVADLAKPLFDKLGAKPRKDDDDNATKLRPTILGMMVYSENQTVIDVCLAEFITYRHELTEIAGDLRSVILAATVKFGDNETFEYLINLYKTSQDADLRQDICAGLTSARQPKQIEQLIANLTKSNAVRPQDLFYWFAWLLSNKHARAKTWAWCRENWDWITETFAGDKSFDMFPRCVGGRFGTRVELAEFDEFFSDKNDLALRRAIDVGRNDTVVRVEWLERDRGEVLKKLTENKKGE